METESGSKFTFQPLGKELMVYDQAQDRVHVLNETAAMILRLYRQGRSPGEIEQELKAHYRLDENHNISEDISLSLKQLADYGLTEEAENL